jgi:hypothetical protein
MLPLPPKEILKAAGGKFCRPQLHDGKINKLIKITNNHENWRYNIDKIIYKIILKGRYKLKNW